MELRESDYSSPQFVNGVNRLADVLGVCKHPNHLITLGAIATLVKNRMSPEVLKNPSDMIPKGEAWPLEKIEKSFDETDEVVDNASRILRLLYIHDLRKLQTKINECIVAIQQITADPKTDTTLGQIGK